MVARRVCEKRRRLDKEKEEEEEKENLVRRFEGEESQVGEHPGAPWRLEFACRNIS